MKSDKFIRKADLSDVYVPGEYDTKWWRHVGEEAGKSAVTDSIIGLEAGPVGAAVGAGIGALTSFVGNTAQQIYYSTLSPQNKASLLAGKVQDLLSGLARLLRAHATPNNGLENLAVGLEQTGSLYKDAIDHDVANKNIDISKNSLYQYINDNNITTSNPNNITTTQSNIPSDTSSENNVPQFNITDLTSFLGGSSATALLDYNNFVKFAQNTNSDIFDYALRGNADNPHQIQDAFKNIGGDIALNTPGNMYFNKKRNPLIDNLKQRWTPIANEVEQNGTKRLLKNPASALGGPLGIIGGVAINYGLDTLGNSIEEKQELQQSIPPYVATVTKLLNTILQLSGNNNNIKIINDGIINSINKYLSVYLN